MTHLTLTDFLTTTLAFAFALGVIIVVHEAGHLLVAKAFGVRVMTFSVGFGKRLWGFTRNGTDYRVSAVPFGGYVRMGGENPEESTGDPREFMSDPVASLSKVPRESAQTNVVTSTRAPRS